MEQSTDTIAQRQRLLETLKRHPVNTLTARTRLAIMAPAARVLELKRRGFEITTRLITAFDDFGTPHKNVAEYILITNEGMK